MGPRCAPVVLLLSLGTLGLTCAPAIEITSPGHGAFVENDSVAVAGTTNGAPGTVVEVNGIPAVVNPDKAWSALVPLDQAAIFDNVVATATEPAEGLSSTARLTVIAGESVADGDFSLQGVALRINDSGLDSLEPLVGGLIDLTGLEVNVDIDGSGLVPNCGLRITSSDTNISGFYDLEPSTAEPSRVDVIQLANLSVTFTGFNEEFTSGACDLPIIGDIIQLLLPDIQDVTEDGVSNFLNTVDADGNTPVAGAVEDALAGVDISGPIGAALGADLDAPFFVISEDATGITLGSDVRFVSTCTPPRARRT